MWSLTDMNQTYISCAILEAHFTNDLNSKYKSEKKKPFYNNFNSGYSLILNFCDSYDGTFVMKWFKFFVYFTLLDCGREYNKLSIKPELV